MTVDMSPAAVTARLRLAAELVRLCFSLATARPVGEAAASWPRPDASGASHANDGER